MVKRTILVRNAIMFDKIRELSFKPHVNIPRNRKTTQSVNNIMKTINKNSKVIDVERTTTNIQLKRCGNLSDFSFFKR